jgi:ribosomal protein S27E
MSTCLACAAGRTVAIFQSVTAVDCFPTTINFTIPTTTIGCPR